MDKQTATAVIDDVKSVLDGVLAHHGLTLTRTSGSYSAAELKVTLTFATVGEMVNGVNLGSQEAADYSRYAAQYGLPEGLLGKVVTLQGRPYAFAGVAIKRRKYPFVFVEQGTGKTVMFTDTPGVKSALAAAAAAA